MKRLIEAVIGLKIESPARFEEPGIHPSVTQIMGEPFEGVSKPREKEFADGIARTLAGQGAETL